MDQQEAKTPVKDPANLTDAEKAKVAEEVKKANPTAKDVEVGKDGTATVTFPDGSTAEIPAAKAVEKAKDAEGVKDPEAKTPVKDPANLTDAEKAKVAEEVKKANPTAKDVEVGKDGTTTVTFPDGTTAVIPADKTVKKSDDKAVKDPSVTPVKDPSNLTDAEKAKVAEEVKKSNPTAKDVEVGKDGTTTVTFPDGTTAVIPADKTVKKSDDKAVKDPSVTPVKDPSNLTDAEKAKVAEEVKKSNPTVTDVKVGKDGATTVTYPDGTTAVIPADKTVKKSDDKVVKDPSVTPVTDPSNLTDAEKAKVADEVKKSNPTAKDVEVGKDGTTTVTYPDGTTAVIPADKTVKKSDDKVVTDPSVTPVTDPSNLTDAEKGKVAEEVKKSNPTVTDVKVGKDGATTVTYPDGTTAVIPADKTVKKSDDKGTKDPSVTPVTDPSNLTDAEKAKVAEEVKKANPTVTDVKVDKDGTTTVTYPDDTTAVIPADKTIKKSADKVVKDPSVTPVTDPSNLTDAEKGKVAEEVKKSNPTVTDVKVDKDGTTTVTYPDGTIAVIPADKTVKKSADKAVKDPSVTPVTDPSNLTDAEKAKVADEVKKSNPTVTDVKVGKDGTTTVTYPDGTTAVIPADKTVKKSDDKVVKDPSVTPVTDPSNLTDAEKAKVAEEVKKANPTASKVEVGNDGTATVTYPDGTTAVLTPKQTITKVSETGNKGNSNSNSDNNSDKTSNTFVKVPAEKTLVKDPSNLTDAERSEIVSKIKQVNPAATVKVDRYGNATVELNGKTVVISSEQLIGSAEETNGQASHQGRLATDSSKKSESGKLPSTGEEQSVASIGLAILSALTGGLLLSKKRKEEE
ncbi:LPXTG cell wall anchor domain-containing protein [Streptococcus anginosus]|uniref:LPXTG cell wall anchor domain-containing protein n=1 Tax=Streptococcus anginosus TaxID=1328 RepID=UPI003081FD1A|nr:LPXTG cell wall anchor domain-containing protein [Streptococcus anginosus]